MEMDVGSHQQATNEPSRRRLSSTDHSADREYDDACVSGNFSIPDTEDMLTEDSENEPSSSVSHRRQRKRWELNYYEASIYLCEGENNDKFTYHPKTQTDLPSYLLSHTTMFHIFHLIASLVLLSLALIEEPSIPLFDVPLPIHGSIELVSLAIITFELGLRLKWLGWKPFLRHKRTLIQTFVMVIMFAEAITILIRQTSHFRASRALRPIFLLDSDYVHGVRRFIRQIIQSLPPIIEMVILLLFFMLIFSTLGFYLFANVDHDTFFGTFQDSFVSLFVLLTTANYPDVMMAAYNSNRWSFLFFVTYIMLEIYLLMNLFLAVVYNKFSEEERVKLRKLLLHKREGCRLAFKLLVSKGNPHSISLRSFEGLLHHFRPRMNKRDVYLTFKALNTTRSGTLSIDEFYNIYEYVGLSWKKKRSNQAWLTHFRSPFDRLIRGINWLVTRKWFDYIVFTVPSGQDFNAIKSLWISVVFVVVYLLEVALKLLGLGPHAYFSSGWDVFDFIVITLTSAFMIAEAFGSRWYYYMVLLMPFRLLRLFKLRRIYRDVLGTVFILFSRFSSLLVVLLLLYYSCAIIGMELFAGFDLKNCCVNSSIEDYYYYSNASERGGFYYLNNFDNIVSSYVTLFELTVVNNWYVIMEAYSMTVTEWSRLYFMLFYLLTMIVMTTVVAFILEAFLFRIRYRAKMQGHDTDDDARMKVDVRLTMEEVEMCLTKTIILQAKYLKQTAMRDGIDTAGDVNSIVFSGSRLRSKYDFSLRMYKEDVKAWIANAGAHALDGSSSLTELISLPSNRASCSSHIASGRVTPDISEHDDGDDLHNSSATFVRTDWDT